MTVEQQLPIINISPFINSSDFDDGARKACVEALRKACEDKGFFQLTGHGIPLEIQDAVFEQTARFFDLPLEEKTHLAKESAPAPRSHRGYEVIGGQMLEENTTKDLKEGYFFGEEHSMDDPRVKQGIINHGPNQWPDEYKMPDFRAIMMDYFARLRKLAPMVMEALALSLGIEKSYFQAFNVDPIATCRLLHYPPQPPDAGPLARGAGKHTDFVREPPNVPSRIRATYHFRVHLLF